MNNLGGGADEEYTHLEPNVIIAVIPGIDDGRVDLLEKKRS